MELYGISGNGPTNNFGRQCLLARRFAEAGVRFIEVEHGNWDTHFNMSTQLPNLCEQIDQPIAGLLTDLKRRGMLDDTLVLWPASSVGLRLHKTVTVAIITTKASQLGWPVAE